jgi:hypothetical protein
MYKIPLTWIVALFLVDKLVQAVKMAPWFIRNYLDDLLLIPLLMGTSLLLQQKLISPKFTYGFGYIFATWLFFSVAFELVAPIFFSSYTKDYCDILAYGFGAVFFYLFQNHPAVNSRV